MLSFLSALILFVLFLTCINGYAIDPVSCKDREYELMEEAAEAAFNLVDQAVAALQQDPRDENVQRLIRLLFGDEPELTKIEESFESLLEVRLKLAPDDDDMDDTTQVMFYCDLERVQLAPRLGQQPRWIDSVTNTAFNDNLGEDIKTCKAGNDFTLAVTWNPPGKIVQDGERFLPLVETASQVTMCPWFIKWAVNKEYKVWDDKSLKVIAATAAIPLLTNNPFNYPLTPVDASSLLEKVILHELTHTISGGQSDDVLMQKGGLWPSKAAYGWTASRNLAEQGGTDENSPSNNADSIALFAIGVRLLGLETPTYIEDNGSLSKKVPNSSKRSVQSTLRYRSTPAAFEGFVTMIQGTPLETASQWSKGRQA